MLIYNHNLHEKLFGYAISREFIKYQSPFCDMLDDPNLALDFDLAIKFNTAINSNPSNAGANTEGTGGTGGANAGGIGGTGGTDNADPLTYPPNIRGVGGGTGVTGDVTPNTTNPTIFTSISSPAAINTLNTGLKLKTNVNITLSGSEKGNIIVNSVGSDVTFDGISVDTSGTDIGSFGNVTPAAAFTNTLILCSTDIDVSTLEFYKHKMETYPIFFSEINRINYTFANLNNLPSDNGGFIDRLKNATKDCLTSPCNLFAPTSNSIGKLAQGTLYASDGAIFPAGSMKNNFATFTGGIDSTVFNKIPEAFQKGLTNLKFIGKNAWSETLTMLTKDSLPELIAKAQNGQSLRTNTKGYRYTPDIKSFFDLNAIGSAILGNIAADMGDCFRRYEQSYRYNPYDPVQNQSTVSRAPMVDQVNGTPYYRNSFGQTVQNNEGGLQKANLSPTEQGNKQTLSIPQGTFVSDYFDFAGSGPNMVTIYGGWIDEEKKIWYQDLTLDTYSKLGQIASSKYLSGPMVYNNYKKNLADGYKDSADLVNFEEQKFNLGIAINFTSLAKYLNSNGKASYTVGSLGKYFYGKTKRDEERLYAEITPEGKSPIFVKIFDIAGSENRLDLTIPTFKRVFGTDPVKTNATDQAGADAAKLDDYSSFTYAHPPVKCKVRFIVGRLSAMQSTAGNGGADKPVTGLSPKLVRLIEEFKTVYPNITITSAYRSPKYNEEVGGANKSQHTLGNAIDLSMRGVGISTTMRVLEWWKSRGAYGFGYYPNSTSIHVDIRENGQYAAWGTNYSKSSLPGTPPEFQAFARSLGVQW